MISAIIERDHRMREHPAVPDPHTESDSEEGSVEPTTKRCNRCSQDKPTDEFAPKRGICKPCDRVRSAEYRAKEKAANPQAAYSRVVAWRAANPERKRAQGVRYRARYPERGAAAQAAWRVRNPERVKANDARWKSANQAKVRVWQQASAATNRARKAGAGVVDLTPADWASVLEEFGYRCAYCGTDQNLTQDHVIPLHRGGHHTRGNVVPACGPCNFRKHTKTAEEFLAVRREAQ